MRAMQNTWFDIDNGAGPINRLVFLRNRHESRIVSRENTEECDDDDDQFCMMLYDDQLGQGEREREREKIRARAHEYPPIHLYYIF